MVTEIPAWACRELMGSTLVGRVAFVDADGPVVLPVNFVLDGNTVLFCTSSANTVGRHLDSATVAFEVDEFDGITKSGWSVLVRGVASFVSAASWRGTRNSAPSRGRTECGRSSSGSRRCSVSGRRLLPG